MLWRESYQPRLVYDVELPVDATFDGIVLRGFGPRARSEIGIWQRLIISLAEPVTYRIALIGDWSTREVKAIKSAFPTSDNDLMVIWKNVVPWTALIQPDRPERSFATIVCGGRAKILVIGPPTEDAWDRFEACLLNNSCTLSPGR